MRNGPVFAVTLKGLLRIQWHFLHYMLTKGEVNYIAFKALKWQPKKSSITKNATNRVILSQIDVTARKPEIHELSLPKIGSCAYTISIT